MSTAEQEFDLSLLSEAELETDPYPDRPLRLTVLGHREDAPGEPVAVIEIRTNEAQFGLVFRKYRALQLALADRARKRALEDAHQEEKGRVLREANEHLPTDSDPFAHIALLDRVRRGLESALEAPAEDPPPGETEP